MNSELGAETQAEAMVLMLAYRAECIDPRVSQRVLRLRLIYLPVIFFFGRWVKSSKNI